MISTAYPQDIQQQFELEFQYLENWLKENLESGDYAVKKYRAYIEYVFFEKEEDMNLFKLCLGHKFKFQDCQDLPD